MPDILFLGTSAAVPSKTHATSCIAVRSGPDIILLDCGEGAQRQLMLSPFSFMKIRAILITPPEEKSFEWALNQGKLKKTGGRQRKKVDVDKHPLDDAKE